MPNENLGDIYKSKIHVKYMIKLKDLKLIMNKKNGQVNVNIPKKKMGIKNFEKMMKKGKIDLRLEGFE